MSATDELRRLLDERGVEYKSHYLHTSWHAGTKLYMATDDANGTLTVDNLTPEQAIAATLNSRAERTCHIEVHDNLAETEGMGDVWIECDECHWQMPLEPTTPRFKHCPNCGCKVVGE